MATATAAARRAEAKVEYDAFVAACPSQKLLGRISDKWVALIIVALTDGSLRYSELSRRIPSASQKMLTQSLRSLERDGLVTRTVTADVPVRVDYALTELGTSLRHLMVRIKAWAEEHMDEVERAREAHAESA
ncbi:transcriptional regulator [Rhodococcus sp. 06-235-1A]|uniref:winged helix-turn-helix transcriptional regulator n=1 Tax=Rhodococcus sp. 06-235-1A TaxID=2022508 RepID=UPI000B9C0478|nr:helix-turn-helix domain-containing protein [Rhodococcus sp. 06-235-1A]OZD07309.1 transcriptional regulator [Rhodococcus sp. 06-235-1A]